MLKINRAPSKNTSPRYCDLKPGDIFYFANDPNKTPRLKIKDAPAFGGSIPRHITLNDPWDTDTSLLDSEVCLLDAELTVSEIR